MNQKLTYKERVLNDEAHNAKKAAMKERVDESDGKLTTLTKEYGEAVLASVINAVQELQEHNASGRYPIPVVWNYKKNRQATLEEVIEFLDVEKSAPEKGGRWS
ncbi:hypothetical protein L7F22_025997 [Adiantum nelumboides]|nr:hypothetical protein [Adiantum nelumboides]